MNTADTLNRLSAVAFGEGGTRFPAILYQAPPLPRDTRRRTGEAEVSQLRCTACRTQSGHYTRKLLAEAQHPRTPTSW